MLKINKEVSYIIETECEEICVSKGEARDLYRELKKEFGEEKGVMELSSVPTRNYNWATPTPLSVSDLSYVYGGEGNG